MPRLSRYTLIVLLFLLAAIGGLVLYMLFVRKNIAANAYSRDSTASVSVPASLPSIQVSGARKPGESSKLQARMPQVQRSARTVYVDQNQTYASRFENLYELAKAGDRDAMHLAYVTLLDCQAWSKMSRKTVLPQLWTPILEATLKTVLEKCDGIQSEAGYDALAQVANDQPRDFFDSAIREQIKISFANDGVEPAISRALSAYRTRPDSTTAGAISDIFSELDLTKYDNIYQISGTDSPSPEYRRSIFNTSLNLLSCEFGVPCGPDSEIVASLCLNGGICHSGYDLRQIYEQFLLSGQDRQNVESILTALRKQSDSIPKIGAF